MRELLVHLRRGLRTMTANKVSFSISLLFPFVAAGITIWIAGQDMFVNMESTQSACFILVCAGIWGGLFNSIQVIVKERHTIKRDYDCGALRLGTHLASRAILQLILCLFQSAVLTATLYGIEKIYGNDFPGFGLLQGSAMLEYYITMFLVVYAADVLGLCISCMVKNEQLASQMSPYILIVQLLFSGMLFTMEGFAKNVSALMISRWGMEALGSISQLNDLPLRLQEAFPMIPHEADAAFRANAPHLLLTWVILFAFIVVPLSIGYFALHSVKNDRRG